MASLSKVRLPAVQCVAVIQWPQEYHGAPRIAYRFLTQRRWIRSSADIAIGIDFKDGADPDGASDPSALALSLAEALTFLLAPLRFRR
jgi:hypothetical protein